MAFDDYFDEKMYKLQGTKEMKEIQREKLISRLNSEYNSNEFFRLYCGEKGIKDISAIKTIEDFKKAFPSVGEVRAAMAEMLGKIWKGNLVDTLSYIAGVSRKDYALMCATSGTGGMPTPYFFTEDDLRVMAKGFSRTCKMCGLMPGETVLHAFALSMFGAGVPLVETLMRLGITVMPVGAEVGKEKLFSFGGMFGATVIFCTPSYAEHLIDTEPKKVKDLNLKRVICGGEPGAGIPEVRKKIQDGFGCPLTDAMGLIGGISLTSCDLEEYAGLHHLSDDILLFELVDPETKEPIPFEDGAVGEYLITALEGTLVGMMPRISAGDVVQISTEPCECGAPGWRMKVQGRTDDMLKVKGVIVYPAHIDGVITSFSPRVTGEFRIVLDSPPPRVEPPLKLKVEYGEGVKEEELPALENEIGEVMHNKLRIRPKIEWLAPMTLERAEMKTRFIEKAYEKK